MTDVICAHWIDFVINHYQILGSILKNSETKNIIQFLETRKGRTHVDPLGSISFHPTKMLHRISAT